MGRRSIRLGALGNPGDYDDEQTFLEEEEEALETMDDISRDEYLLAKAFIAANPPNSITSDISLSQFLTIQEKGVSAWEFEVDFPNANCFVEGRTEIEFFDLTCSSQTNLPVPRQNEVYYWEAKMYEKPETTLVSVGLSTKPYPTFRLPGYHRYSIAYDSLGIRRMNQPFYAPPGYGPPLLQGDVVGVGYRPRTGTVFFTRNGKKLEELVHGYRLNFFPTVGATGPCKVSVNFGQAGFVFIEANVKKWGLAPATGSLAPPPPYGAERDFVLLESGSSSHQQQQQQQQQQTQNSYSHKNIPPLPLVSPPPFERSITEDQTPGAPDQVNISLSSLVSSSISATSSSARQTPDYSRHDQGESSQSLLQHSPPPSYTSDTDSISEADDV